MTLDQSTKKRITAAVDEAFDAQLTFTQDLVRHPSLRTQESSAQQFLFDAMQQRGLEMDRWQLDVDEIAVHPGAGAVTVSYEDVVNVVGTWNPAAAEGRSLILNGHVDVVPEGPREQWSSSPWDSYIKDGWLYGRGSGDMKAGLAANLFAFDAVRAAGFEPTARIHFQSVVEEECTGNGSLAAHLRGYKADAVIIPEPEEDMLVRANVGVIWFRLEVAGQPTHPREMRLGFNAIDAAYHVVGQLRTLEDGWNTERGAHQYFEEVDHPINLNMGEIRGGDWPSSVPAWCDVDLRVALYPGMSAESVWKQIRELLETIKVDGQGNAIQVQAVKTGFFAEGYVLEEGSEAEGVLQRAHHSAFGEGLQSFVTPGYLDGRVFTLYADTPTLVYGPISKAIHGYDERVDIESVRRITKSIALFIAEWCGVRDIQK